MEPSSRGKARTLRKPSGQSICACNIGDSSLTPVNTCYFISLLQSSSVNLVSALWQLMEGGLEELRILQTIILLITTSNIVHGENLGKVSKFCLIGVYLKSFDP